jgi:chromosome segregation ATPase
MNKIKEKNLNLISNFNSKIENIQNNNLLMKEKADKLSEEIANLKSENIKLNNSIEEYKKLIDTQKENENLFKSLQEGKNKSKINSFNNKLIQWNNVIKIDSVNSLKYIHSKPKIKPININNMPNNNQSNYSNIVNYSNIYTQAQSTKNSNYHKKKKEIINLKEQVESVKNEINNIMLTSINQNERFFTISNKDDIDNNDITSRSFIDTNNNNNTNNFQKKIKNLQKLLKKEKNKNVNLEKENNSLKEHINTLNMNLTEQFNNINSTNNTEMVLSNNIFTPKFFINMFYDINQKIFSSSELKKYYKIYDVADLQTIFNIFVESCECLKNQLYETYFDMDSPNSDYEDNNISSKNMAIDSSYRLVNEKIIKLKKLEFDFANLSEFVKNYLVSQEIIVKIIFDSDNDFIQFEPIEKLFNLFEECLNFKIDEMSDNVIFYRKLLIRIFKNQKNCLGLSLEYLSQD